MIKIMLIGLAICMLSAASTALLYHLVKLHALRRRGRVDKRTLWIGWDAIGRPLTLEGRRLYGTRVEWELAGLAAELEVFAAAGKDLSKYRRL